MKDFLKLWYMSLKMIFKTWAEYRADFVIGIVAMFVANITSMVYFWVVFQNITSLNGWSFGQILFLSGMLSLSNGISHTFLSGVSPWSVEEYVRSGELDRILLKPVGTLRYFLISSIDEDGFGEIGASILIIFTGASLSGIIWNVQTIGLFLLFAISGALIIFSIFLFFSSLAFWTTRIHSLSDAVFSLMKFVRYPLEIYNPFIIFFLSFVVPLAFVNYYPAEMFFGKGSYFYFAYITPLIGITMLVLSKLFWNFSIKHYTSTGS